MPPPKADQALTEASARAIDRWYSAERWKARGRALLLLLVWTAIIVALLGPFAYQNGLADGYLRCLP
jgi:hypothetical protein